MCLSHIEGYSISFDDEFCSFSDQNRQPEFATRSSVRAMALKPLDLVIIYGPRVYDLNSIEFFHESETDSKSESSPNFSNRLGPLPRK